MSRSSRPFRFPLAIMLGFAASGGVAAWYLQFSLAGLLAWAGFLGAGLVLAGLVARRPV
jgi:hypothetical protein